MLVGCMTCKYFKIYAFDHPCDICIAGSEHIGGCESCVHKLKQRHDTPCDICDGGNHYCEDEEESRILRKKLGTR
jgi:hypothetical protein